MIKYIVLDHLFSLTVKIRICEVLPLLLGEYFLQIYKRWYTVTIKFMDDTQQLNLFGFKEPEKPKESFLFFDTETTGLPRNWNAPVTDLDNWPRLVQLAWLSFDKDGNKTTEGNYIIKPEGFIIPADSAKVHGITMERAEREGVALRGVLEKFRDEIERVTHIVAHNISFDEKIIGAEFLRSEISHAFEAKNKICTMTSSVDFCAIPGGRGFKWPKLQELHKKLFGAEFADAHDASVDIAMTAKCFWELKKRGVI